MKVSKLVISALTLTIFFACPPGKTTRCYASLQHSFVKPAQSVKTVKNGRLTFLKRCRFCHGQNGEGDGPAAKYLDPKPRNFRSGVFKLRSTSSGALPTDEDLFHTIKNGIPGTAMPAFGNRKNGLSDNHIRQVIFFLQTLSDLWTDDKEFSKSSDPDDREEYRYNRVEKISPPPPFSQELLREGAEIYDTAKCYECHGKNGRGDGETAYKLKDDWRESIFPRNLHKGWRYKRGDNARDIFNTITTGMNGTPMPSFKQALSERKRWALSFYIESLAEGFTDQKLLKVRYTDSEIPFNPEDPVWKYAEKLDVPLSGQILTMPRWPIHSVDLVKVKALYNDHNIAFLLNWDDRKKDTAGTNPPNEGQNNTENLPDGLALQFFSPTQYPSELPHFLNGSDGKKVRIWFWNSTKESGNGARVAVKEFSASGPKKPFVSLPGEGQKSEAASFYSDGRWRLIIISSLSGRGFSNARDGMPISFALNIWDGSAGESGLKKSVSSWKWLRLLPPKSRLVYIYPLLTFILTFIPGTLLYLGLSEKNRNSSPSTVHRKL